MNKRFAVPFDKIRTGFETTAALCLLRTNGLVVLIQRCTALDAHMDLR